jgi:hypothetical protein
MRLQDHNVIKAIMEAITQPEMDSAHIERDLPLRDGLPVTRIDGVPCAMDVVNGVIQAGEGREQQWFEVHLRDVTPKRFRSPEEQTKLEQEHEDWWHVSSSQRSVFVRNRSRSGAVEDFLRRFPGEAASGLDMPDAELARGFEFIDDEGDRIRAEFIAKEVMETEAEAAPDPQYPQPGQNSASSQGVGGCPAGQCSCGGCYPEPSEDEEQDEQDDDINAVDPNDPYQNLKPEECYFGVAGESCGGDPDSKWLMVCPKDYWDKNHRAYDGYLGNIWKHFPSYMQAPEDMECTWAIPDDKGTEDVAIDMTVAGFERNLELESLIEAEEP